MGIDHSLARNDTFAAHYCLPFTVHCLSEAVPRPAMKMNGDVRHVGVT